jgi:Tol biopolymer transport system component
MPPRRALVLSTTGRRSVVEVIEWLRGAWAGRDRVAVFVGAMLLCGCTGPVAPTAPTSTSLGSMTGTAPSLTGQIAFAEDGTSDQRHEQIYLERADGSNVRQLVHSRASDVNPALSPDGRRLVFTRHVDSTPDRIFLVDVDGSGLEPLVPSNCPDVCSDSVEGSAWSPDGRRLVFTRAILHGRSTEPTAVELWLTNTDGREAHRLTQKPAETVGGRPGAQDGFAGWAPDGTRVVFTHRERGTPPSPDQFAVYTIKPDGTDPRQLTPNDIQAGDAVWSPDGTLIAFLSPPDAETFPKVVYTMRPDGSGMTPLTSDLDVNDSDDPAWSPDSRQIVFSHVAPGTSTGADLYVVGRGGGQPHPIAVTALNEKDPSWGVEPS